jgi:hypothetical protein
MGEARTTLEAAGLPPLPDQKLAARDMMGGGMRRSVVWRHGFVEAARAHAFSIDGMVLVSSLACSWFGPLGLDYGQRGSSSLLLFDASPSCWRGSLERPDPLGGGRRHEGLLVYIGK